MNDEKEHFIPASDSSRIFPDLRGVYAPLRHAIDWSDPDSQRFLSLIERIATALEERETAKKPLHREHKGLLAQEKWLQETIREAIQVEGAHHKQYYLQLIARQLGVFIEDSNPGVAP